MTVEAKSKDYQAGLELAEMGKYDEALERIRNYLGTAPDDVEALNDAGAILNCLGRWDEAIEYFLKARSLQTDSAEIIWNLSETYLAVGKTTEAVELFDEMERLGILNADVLNRAANVFLNEDDSEGAMKMLKRSLEMCPDQEILKPMIEVINYKMEEKGDK